jgi:hypothetical protein
MLSTDAGSPDIHIQLKYNSLGLIKIDSNRIDDASFYGNLRCVVKAVRTLLYITLIFFRSVDLVLRLVN